MGCCSSTDQSPANGQRQKVGQKGKRSQYEVQGDAKRRSGPDGEVSEPQRARESDSDQTLPPKNGESSRPAYGGVPVPKTRVAPSKETGSAAEDSAPNAMQQVHVGSSSSNNENVN